MRNLLLFFKPFYHGVILVLTAKRTIYETGEIL